MYDRTQFAPRGFLGGKDGRPGELFLSDGTPVPPKATYDLEAGTSVTLKLPGGGGYGPPLERDPARVLEDVRQERVSRESAQRDYGVVIDETAMRVDLEKTERCRSGGQEGGGANRVGGIS
jgi:N-methylhydantoinase B